MYKLHNLFIISGLSIILILSIHFPYKLSAQELEYVETEYVPQTSIDGLRNAKNIVISPDGANLYVAGFGEQTIAVFSLDSLTGKLSFRKVHKNGSNGVTVMIRPQGIAVSPDGRNVYVGTAEYSGLVVYMRDLATGDLSFVEEHKNSLPDGYNGLSGTRAIIVSRDGRHVYTVGYYDDAVVMFERNQTNGALTYIGIQKRGMPDIPEYFHPQAITISSDGNYVYVAGFGGYLAVFARNITTGILTFVELFKDSDTGIDGLAWARSVIISPDDRHVYACGENDNAIALFRRDATTGALTYMSTIKDGVNGFSGLQGVWQITLNPRGDYLYAIGGKHSAIEGYTHDAVTVFKRDSVTGNLTLFQVFQHGEDNADYLRVMRGLAVTPDGQHLYTTSYRDHAVSHFSRHHVSDQLNYQESILDGNWTHEFISNSVTVSPDGAHVYTTGRGGVAILSKSSDGSLDYTDVQDFMAMRESWKHSARCAAISPDGAHIYVAGYVDALVVFERDAVSGTLTVIEVHKRGENSLQALNGASAVKVSPDGTRVYAAGHSDGTLVVFSRDQSTGRLHFLRKFQDGINDVDGLAGVNDLAVSPDGNCIYAASENDNAVAVFRHNVIADSLEFTQVLKNDSANIHGLDGASKIAVSPNGAFVFVVSVDDEAVAVFKRNLLSGKLSLLEVEQNDLWGIASMGEPNSIVISPDNTQVFVTSIYNTVAIFQLNPATGALTYIEHHRIERNPHTPSPRYFSGISVSPEGEYVFITGYDDDAIVAFKRTVSSVEIPREYELYQNVPNPFNPSTAIYYRLTQPETVQLSIYNLLGQEVRRLQNGEHMPAGVHNVVWNGNNQSGVAVASGVYIYTLQIGNDIVRSKKMLLLK